MTAPKFDRSISVVLPAYNEEACIGEAVRQCLEYFPATFREVEIIVVDDGSTDGTAEVVRELAAEHPEVQLESFPQNRGYGRAISAGFERGAGELMFYTDSDCQFDVTEVSDLVPLLDDADVVLGFRVYRYDSVLRCLLSWIYNRLVRVLFRVRVRDVDCAFKLITRPVVDALEVDCTDFFVDTEIVARCRRMGARITERGVRHYPRRAGHTTVRPGDIPRTLMTVARMWLRLRKVPSGTLRK